METLGKKLGLDNSSTPTGSSTYTSCQMSSEDIGVAQYTHIKDGRNKRYFTSNNNPLNGDNKYTASDICKTTEFLVDYINVRFSRQLFRHTVGIPMGTNCVPLLTDLFLYSYENKFLNKLIKEGKRKLARKFSLSYRHTDDLTSFNNKRLVHF